MALCKTTARKQLCSGEAERKEQLHQVSWDRSQASREEVSLGGGQARAHVEPVEAGTGKKWILPKFRGISTQTLDFMPPKPKHL